MYPFIAIEGYVITILRHNIKFVCMHVQVHYMHDMPKPNSNLYSSQVSVTVNVFHRLSMWFAPKGMRKLPLIPCKVVLD